MRNFLWIATALVLVSPVAEGAETVIPGGVRLNVRVDEGLNTKWNHAGDHFTASLVEPVVLDGRNVLPAGTQFAGHVTIARHSGRLKGRAILGMTLDSFNLGGRDYHVVTSRIDRVSGSHKKRNIALIAGGAGVGATAGAIAGGPPGAAIGAGAGAGVGVATAAITGRKQVGVHSESGVTFSLRSSVRLIT